MRIDALSGTRTACAAAAAGGAELENAAAEGPEVLESAVGVRALDSGDTSEVVTAGEEPLHRLGDPLEAELPEPLGELGLVARAELGGSGRGTAPAANLYPAGGRSRAAHPGIAPVDRPHGEKRANSAACISRIAIFSITNKCNLR